MGSKNNIEALLNQIEDILDEGTKAAFSNLVKVDADEIQNTVNEIRNILPNEIAQAKTICADRNKILNDAKDMGDEIIAKANEEAARLVSNDSITIAARDEADRIMAEARDKAAAYEAKCTENMNIRQANAEKYEHDLIENANNYVEDLMMRSAQQLSSAIQDLKVSTKNMEEHQADISTMMDRWRKARKNRQ